MKLLVDTHAILWAAEGSRKLSSAAGKALASDRHERFISIASVWELALKWRLGKFNRPGGFTEFIDNSFNEMDAVALPITLDHALRVSEIPRHHGDPFDLILIAQSQVENMTIITADTRIEQYDVRVLW